MSKSLLLAILGLGLAAGGYFLLSKSPSDSGGGATPQAKERPAESAATTEGLRAPAADATTAANANASAVGDRQAAQTTLEGVTGVAGFLLPEREINGIEKQSVRDLVKLHRDAGGDGRIADPLERPPGTDADSLEIKFGSMDVATLQQEHASRRAILKWQSEGPFEDKTLEILPGEQLRVMEIEMEWLEQRILYP
ncbi:MAG: hypothetical protein HUU28_12355 [Planctomycetaceae bacterium]|nr:hypothetical protein [Planctomycetaceae bacterium]